MTLACICMVVTLRHSEKHVGENAYTCSLSPIYIFFVLEISVINSLQKKLEVGLNKKQAKFNDLIQIMCGRSWCVCTTIHSCTNTVILKESWQKFKFDTHDFHSVV